MAPVKGRRAHKVPQVGPGDEPVRNRVDSVSGPAFPKQPTFFVPNFVPEYVDLT